jgi:hypothetical protein
MPLAAVAAGLGALALSLPPVAPVGLPGTALTRITGGSPFARSCTGAVAQRGSEVEPTLAASPDGSGLLVAAWQQDRYPAAAAAGIGVRVSHDGGASWSAADVPTITSCTRRRYASDPWASIGADGRAYLAVLEGERNPRGFHTRIAVSTLGPGGSRWSSPALLDAGRNGFNDKPSVTADPFVPGRAYAVWTLEGTAFMSRTVDGGRSWAPPRMIARPPRPGGLLASTISVLRGGVLLHVFMAYGPGRLVLSAARSADGGAHWSRPLVVTRLPRSRAVSTGGRRARVRAIPVSGTGPAVTRSGAVYEAFTRARAGGDSVAVVRSLDGGRSWSRPRVALRHRGTVFAPALVAGGGGGELALSYYAVSRDGRRAAFWIARSHDGVGWTRRRVAAPFPLRAAPVSGREAFLGDYTGLAAVPGGFAAAFAAAPPVASAGRSDVVVAGSL